MKAHRDRVKRRRHVLRRVVVIGKSGLSCMKHVHWTLHRWDFKYAGAAQRLLMFMYGAIHMSSILCCLRRSNCD